MKKRFFAALFTTLLLMVVLAMQASAATVDSGVCGGNVRYVLDDNGTLTLSGTGSMTDYSSSYAIPWYSNCTAITSVIIEDGITTIGDRIFNSCSALVDISIPNSVESIGAYSFYGCSKLSELVLPDTLKTIDEFAFYYCSDLTSINIPSRVESIGKAAFSDCTSLPALEIPASVERIGIAAFYDCTSLTVVHVAEDNLSYCDVGGIVFNKEKSELVLYPAGRTATEYAVPAGVTKIGDYSFFNCAALTEVTIPDGVTAIGEYAFRQCDALTGITIPSSVERIGSNAFYGCINLAELNLSPGLTSIGSYAFYYGHSLTEVTLPDTLTNIGKNAFHYCINLHTLTILSEDIFIDEYAFTGCKKLTNLRFAGDIPPKTEYYTFYGGVITAYFPVDGEGWAEFIPIKRSGTITWAAYSDVDSVASGTYGDEEVLSWSLDQDGTLFLTGAGAMPDFEECGAPWNEYCADIKNVVIAAGITHIGGYSFFGCPALEQLWFLGNAPAFHENAFSGIEARAKFSVEKSSWSTTRKQDYGGSITWIPIGKDSTVLASGTYGENGIWTLDYNGYMCIDGTEDIPDYELYKTPWHRYREYVTTLVVKNKISKIGTFAFYAFNKLEAAYLVSDCDEMVLNERAFYACRLMTEISLPSATTVGPEVFRACSKLKEIYINDAPGMDALASFKAGSDSFYGLTATVYYPSGLNATPNLGNFGAKKLTWSQVSYGTCGAGIDWRFDETIGALYISGVGFLRNYPSNRYVPWNHLSADITQVVMEEGIMELPAYIFANLINAETITLPQSLQTVCCSTFENCAKLNNLVLPALKEFTDTQFTGCTALTDLYYLGTAEEWDEAENSDDVSDNEELTIHFLILHDTTATCTQPGMAAYYLFDDTSVYDGMYGMEKNTLSELPEVSMLGHSYTDKPSDELAEEATCMTRAKYYAQCNRCTEISETCTVEVGGYEPHVFTRYTPSGNATCKTDETERAFCDNGCGAVDERSIANSRVGHVFTAYSANSDATCTADGTETAFCDFGCHTIDVRADVGSKGIHRFVVYASNEDASCTENGTETAFCAFDCGTTNTRTEEESMRDHVFTAYITNGDATCQADGTETAYCSFDCGTTDTRAAVNSKTDHVFTAYIANGDATCQNAGTETAVCDYNCGTADTRASVNATDEHKFTVYNLNGDATCTVDGTETAFCDYGCHTTDTRTVVGSKYDHIFSVYSSNNDATCLVDGTETAHCSFGCGITDTRAAVNSKVDHKYNAYTFNNDATCQADGTETAFCEFDCGSTDTRTVEGSKVDHTYTDEADVVCNECGFVREVQGTVPSVPMFRMYDPNSGEHFYTGSVEEREILVATGWNYEGVAFNFPVVGAPVHRLYNPETGDHLYTMNETEKADLLAQGWSYEGVAFNSAASDQVPQYRVWNPNAYNEPGRRGAWHFTSSAEERDYLISLGWKDQGIGWYSEWV